MLYASSICLHTLSTFLSYGGGCRVSSRMAVTATPLCSQGVPDILGTKRTKKRARSFGSRCLKGFQRKATEESRVFSRSLFVKVNLYSRMWQNKRTLPDKLCVLMRSLYIIIYLNLRISNYNLISSISRYIISLKDK